MRTILFEDHSYRRLLPLAWSVPTYEIRCGLFNTRERVELSIPAAPAAENVLLCREELAPLNTSPQWQADAGILDDRSLWINGRLAPTAALVSKLVSLRHEDWVLRDAEGLLAASVPVATGLELLESWQQWQMQAWQNVMWNLPASLEDMTAPGLGDYDGVQDLGWTWDVVPATSDAITNDLVLTADDALISRFPYGLVTAELASWQKPGFLRRIENEDCPAGVTLTGDGGLYLGSGGVELAAGTHLDTSGGPIVLDSGVSVQPHCYLAGPLYIGRDSTVKPGARIFGESSFGVGNRLAGEIGECTFGDFANKQHDGFMGHAVLGSWINLGAMSTCSDLKNNYGPVRVNLGQGEQDTGLRFVGLMMGDHAKTAIGSLFNTGTVVGFASNIFGGGMPPKYVPNFSWGGQSGAPTYDGERAQQTGQVVMERRQCVWTDGHKDLFAKLFALCADG